MYAGSAPHSARDTTDGWAGVVVAAVVAVVAEVVVDVAAAALRRLVAGAASALVVAVVLGGPSERPSTVRWAIGRSAVTRTATAWRTVCSAPYVVPSRRSCPD